MGLESVNIFVRKSKVTKRIRQYDSYLEHEIASHAANAGFESIAGTIREEECARVLQLARDKLYENFPEMRPVGYKTVAELDKEKTSKRQI